MSVELCPNCRQTLLEAKKTPGWMYCPRHFAKSNPCAFKGKKVNKAKVGGQPVKRLTNATPEQDTILRAMMTPGHIITNALAGTGKSTIMGEAAVRLVEAGRSVAYMAFASRDKTSFEGKYGSAGVKVYTSNGAGFGILCAYVRKANGVTKLNVDKFLPNLLLDAILTEAGEMTGNLENGRELKTLTWDAYNAIKDSVDKVRSCLLLHYPARPQPEDYLDMLSRFGVEYPEDKSGEITQYADALFTRLADVSTLAVHGTDLTGQIFLPVYHRLTPTTRYQVVIVDEGQDQNPYTRALAWLYLVPGGSVVTVGDVNQAIYEWRGADSESLNEMAGLMEGQSGSPPRQFPLTVCWRCSKAVIRDAKCLVPAIQAAPNAPEGESRRLATVEMLTAELMERKTGLVICRVNAPLISLCLKLLAQGVRAVLAKNNIVGQLSALVDKLSKENDGAATADVIAASGDWLETLLAKFAKHRDGEKKAQTARDKADCILALCSNHNARTAGDVKAMLQRLFPVGEEIDADNAIVCSTVHGQKGGEANAVYLLSPADPKSGASVFDQVWGSARDRDNTLYVAITRAKLTVTYVGPMPTLQPFASVYDGNDSEE